MFVLVSPLIAFFLLWPYIQWRREKLLSTQDTIERSTLPAIRPEVSLSVIVPAYNETERLPAMLNEAIAVSFFVACVLLFLVLDRPSQHGAGFFVGDACN